MLIIPAIDLKDGACVRLRQGRMEDSTVFSDDPVSMAAKWVEGGCRRLHLVDLNGAFEGQPVNGEVVTAIAKRYPNLPIQIGGGIRTLETIEHYVRAGVSYVIIGTKAVKEPEFVSEACKAFPGKVIVGLDAKDGFVATDGWAEVSSAQATDLAKRFEADGVSAIVYTDIAKDGMMQGCNVEATAALAAASKENCGTATSSTWAPLSLACWQMRRMLAWAVSALIWRRKSLPPMLTTTRAGACSCSKSGRRSNAWALVSPEMPALITSQPVRSASKLGQASSALAPTPWVSESPRASTVASAGSAWAWGGRLPQAARAMAAVLASRMWRRCKSGGKRMRQAPLKLTDRNGFVGG